MPTQSAYIAVLGSGNALDPHNTVFQNRLTHAANLSIEKGGIPIIIFGRKQETMPKGLSEAQSGKQFLEQTYPDMPFTIICEDDIEVKSISATARLLIEKYLTGRQTRIYVVIQSLHMNRTFASLAYFAKRQGLDWDEEEEYRFIPSPAPDDRVGLTYLRAFIREMGSWVKHLLDPQDKYINQNR